MCTYIQRNLCACTWSVAYAVGHVSHVHQYNVHDYENHISLLHNLLYVRMYIKIN